MLFVELIRTIAPISRFKKIREAGIIFILFAVTGCSPEVNYDQCVLDAAESGKSEYATQLMVEVCDRKKAEQEAITNLQKNEPCYQKIREDYRNIAYRRYPEKYAEGKYLRNWDFNSTDRERSIDRFNVVVEGFKYYQDKNDRECSSEDFDIYIRDFSANIANDLNEYSNDKFYEIYGDPEGADAAADSAEAALADF